MKTLSQLMRLNEIKLSDYIQKEISPLIEIDYDKADAFRRWHVWIDFEDENEEGRPIDRRVNLHFNNKRELCEWVADGTAKKFAENYAPDSQVNEI